MKKIIFIIIILGLLTSLFWSYFCFIKTDYFKVVFFDVGQGDAALIIAPGGKVILIDGGPDDLVLRGLGDVLPFWKKQIDLLLITHAHDDHIAGLIEVTRRYQVKRVLYNNLDFKTPILSTLKKVFKENSISTTEVFSGTNFKFDNNCNFKILSANKEKGQEENDYSVVSMFDCLNKRVLLTGDAGVKIETELLGRELNLKSDILKIAHHGSLTANSLDFLQIIKPLVAVISVGRNNKFNHPNPTILQRLQKLPVDIYRTDTQGLIEFLANNKIIKLIN